VADAWRNTRREVPVEVVGEIDFFIKDTGPSNKGVGIFFWLIGRPVTPPSSTDYQQTAAKEAEPI